MRQERCDLCRAYDAEKHQCRRHAPNNFFLGMAETNTVDAQGIRRQAPATFGTWPPVDPDDWCLEFQAGAVLEVFPAEKPEPA